MKRQPTREEDESFALAIAPAMQDLMDTVRARLPEGTHFAVLVEAKGNGCARVIAASTDRQHMALRAAEWALSVRSGGDR